MSWTTFEPGFYWPFVDVMPNYDFIEHEFGENCVCGPDVDFGGEVPMYIHHSLDGRERYE